MQIRLVPKRVYLTPQKEISKKGAWWERKWEVTVGVTRKLTQGKKGGSLFLSERQLEACGSMRCIIMYRGPGDKTGMEL